MKGQNTNRERITKLRQFIKRRTEIRAELKAAGIPARDSRMSPEARTLIRDSAYSLVEDFSGEEYVFGAAVALDGVDPGIQGLPKDHPMLWAMAALLGPMRVNYFNVNYMRRRANALAEAKENGVGLELLADYLASKKRNKQYKIPRTPSPHSRVNPDKVGKRAKPKRAIAPAKSATRSK